ncbi:MAG: hypothetical protein J6023_00300 [Clostridia bacterium]|nr:hypothetical protein [Clostridia bacterium]
MHLNKKIRFLSLLLFLAMAFSILSGCGSQTTEPDTAETKEGTTETENTQPVYATKNITKEDLEGYQIIRSDYLLSNSEIIVKGVALTKAINSALGTNIAMNNDWKDKKDEDTSANLEILIGETNRPESTEAAEKLQEGQFFIGIIGNKYVIQGIDTYGALAAIDFVLNDLLKYDTATSSSPAVDSIAFPVSYIGTYELPLDLYIITKKFADFPENEVARLVASFQGIWNRPENIKVNHSYLYIMNDSQDSFWKLYLQEDGKLLSNTREVGIGNFKDFWKLFGEKIIELGMVVWDPDVPATSNVAATICGVEGYLPVMYSSGSASLYSKLKSLGVPEKMNLVGMFEDAAKGGNIADTDLISTGSSKCDAYVWAMDKYFDKTNQDGMAYVLDGAGTIPTNPIYQAAVAGGQATGPNPNQIFSHDYFIQNKLFFFDLTMVADEKPCDDPDQPMGADAETLKMILQAFYERANGRMITVYGFPMWWMKYTAFLDHGKTPATTLEWDFVQLITSYNCLKEADAAHPAWMSNASVYSQFQIDTSVLKNNNESLEPNKEFERDVRYFTIYMGDYDSGAWMKDKIPTFFRDARRGKIPFMWAFNPNLSKRVPMVFQYVYENLTEKDFVVAGDSGAGYVIPSALVSDEIREGRPSGAQAWIDWCKPFMEEFQIDIVGFIINGNNRMTNEVFAMYNEIAPTGSFHNDNSAGKRLIIYNGVPYLHLQNGINPSGGETTYKAMLDYMNGGNGINFAAYRTVCKEPKDVYTCVTEFIEYAEAHSNYYYEYVDPYTLFNLILQSGQGVKINE